MARYRCRRHAFLVSSIIKILFSYNKDTLHLSKSLETVSVSVSPTLNYWIGNSLGNDRDRGDYRGTMGTGIACFIFCIQFLLVSTTIQNEVEVIFY